MSSLLVDISNLIVTKLNASISEYGVQFIAALRFAPSFEARELKNITVSVAPQELSSKPFTRASWQRDPVIDIGIQKKVGPDFETELPALIEVTEKIAKSFENWQPADNIICLSSSIDPIYDAASLRTSGIFVSVISLSLKTVGA